MYVAWRMIFDQRRRLIGFAIGMAALVMVYLPLFESMMETDLLGAKLDALPPALVEALGFESVSTAAGYAQATIYGLVGMVVAVVLAVGAGAWAIAGDEEAGALELTIAHAVGRRSLVGRRAMAIAIMGAVVTGVAGITVAVVDTVWRLGIGGEGIVGATLALTGLVWTFGAIALMVGSITGSRGLALSVTGGVGVFAYLSNTVLADTAAGGLFQAISPFHWAYGERPLVTGVDPGGLARLLVTTLVAVTVATWAFDRRDLH